MTAPAADRPVVAFGGYLALAIVFLWPLSASPTDSVAYVGDSLATVYFIAENGRRLFSNPRFVWWRVRGHGRSTVGAFRRSRSSLGPQD